MTKDTLTIKSIDLSEYLQSMKVTVGQPSEPYKHSYTPSSYRWESVHDATVRRTHIESPMMEWSDPLRNWPDTNLLRLIRKALRTYPKRMSRAQRKEARAREQRRLERNRKQDMRSR